MDQARTLRHLLGHSAQTISPILGDMGQDYAACIARFLLERQAKLGHSSVLFDGSVRGLSALLANSSRADLISFFTNQINLEDLAIELAKDQFLVPAHQGLSALATNPSQAAALQGKLHRLPASCDKRYATLPYEATALAARFADNEDWVWVVQPTARSVTRAFQALRSSNCASANVQHRVIVVGVRNADEADHVFANLAETSTPYLLRPLQYCGHLPLIDNKIPLTKVEKEVISAGRRIAKAICSTQEHALA